MMGDIDVFTLPETVWQDVRFAARMLLKHSSFTAIAILALGLGIGVNAAIFTVYRAFLLRGIDAKDNGQMVTSAPSTIQARGVPRSVIRISRRTGIAILPSPGWSRLWETKSL